MGEKNQDGGAPYGQNLKKLFSLPGWVATAGLFVYNKNDMDFCAELLTAPLKIKLTRDDLRVTDNPVQPKALENGRSVCCVMLPRSTGPGYKAWGQKRFGGQTVGIMPVLMEKKERIFL